MLLCLLAACLESKFILFSLAMYLSQDITHCLISKQNMFLIPCGALLSIPDDEDNKAWHMSHTFQAK